MSDRDPLAEHGDLEPTSDACGECDCADEMPRDPNDEDNLTFSVVSRINRARCERWHPDFPDDGWTGADWSNAMVGEAGETCNVVKKLRRDDFGKVQAAADGRADLLAKLAMEIGDTYLYLDLLAQFYGLNIATCVADTFNRVSVREGFPERIGLVPAPLVSADEADTPQVPAKVFGPGSAEPPKVPIHGLSVTGLTDENQALADPTWGIQYAVLDTFGTHHAYGDQSWVAYGDAVRDSHPDGKVQYRRIAITYGPWLDAAPAGDQP